MNKILGVNRELFMVETVADEIFQYRSDDLDMIPEPGNSYTILD
jgi:hypothetical protein